MTTRDDISRLPPTAWQQLRQRSLSVEAIRQVDRIAIERYRMNSLVLMENAAIGCAQWIIEHWNGAAGASHSPVAVILCGRGNNGGDGLAIARHLLLAGWDCQVVQLGPIDRLSPDARSNWNVLTAKQARHCTVLGEEPADQLNDIALRMSHADVIIDALLGSGAQGTPRQPMSDLIQLSNNSTAWRVAIDIPSGLDATTGQPALPAFCAAATLTFVARKVGFDAPSAQAYLGHVEVLPIGIPIELVEELLAGSAQ